MVRLQIQGELRASTLNIICIQDMYLHYAKKVCLFPSQEVVGRPADRVSVLRRYVAVKYTKSIFQVCSGCVMRVTSLPNNGRPTAVTPNQETSGA